MAEKRKEEADVPVDFEGNRDFLERTGVSEWMRGALAKIVANRPPDPVAFLAQYFENKDEKNSKTSRAYQLLIQTDHTRNAFKTNVAMAYEVLTSSKSSSGLTGTSYNDLLDTIYADVPKSIYSNFLKKVGPREHEVIPYDVFYSGVVAAFILVEYCHRTQALFFASVLSKDCEPVVDSSLAETLVASLTDAVSASKSKDPLMLLEAGARFTDEDLSDEIVESMSVSQSSNRPAMNKDEFLVMAINVYLQEIKPLR
ncbi:tubulin polyglutamylase complex subunit 1-like [Amphiura filiformis]|uniref:tubulin polyglutamylase complex subunit 1-like n=1 Tax=Amphiura filiformis TaxID=82378 RepID=UPI003B20FBB6